MNTSTGSPIKNSGVRDTYILIDPRKVASNLDDPSFMMPFEQVLVTCTGLDVEPKNMPVQHQQDFKGELPVIGTFTPMPNSSTVMFTDRMVVNNDNFQTGEVIKCNIPGDKDSFTLDVKFIDATGKLRDLWRAPGENVTIELVFWKE